MVFIFNAFIIVDRNLVGFLFKMSIAARLNESSSIYIYYNDLFEKEYFSDHKKLKREISYVGLYVS